MFTDKYYSQIDLLHTSRLILELVFREQSFSPPVTCIGLIAIKYHLPQFRTHDTTCLLVRSIVQPHVPTNRSPLITCKFKSLSLQQRHRTPAVSFYIYRTFVYPAITAIIKTRSLADIVQQGSNDDTATVKSLGLLQSIKTCPQRVLCQAPLPIVMSVY